MDHASCIYVYSASFHLVYQQDTPKFGSINLDRAQLPKHHLNLVSELYEMVVLELHLPVQHFLQIEGSDPDQPDDLALVLADR